MALIRYEYPDSSVSEFDRMINRAFSNFGRRSASENDPFFGPRAARVPVDLYEDNDSYHVRAELPGVKKEDIKLELENAVLTLYGVRKTKSGDSEEVTSLSRSVSVGDNIQSDKVKAHFEDGVLTVTMPKNEQRKPRTIAIK
jgi:HSP20 family protein